MKIRKVFFLLLICTISVSAIYSQSNDHEIRELENFDQVTVAMGIDLTLVHGDQNVAEVDVENIELDDVLTKVDGRRLVIKLKGMDLKFKKNVKKNVNVKLTYKELEKIQANSGASVYSDMAVTSELMEVIATSGATIELALESDKVMAKANTGSVIELEGECNQLIVSAGTGSEIDGRNFETNIVEAKANTGSELRVWAKEKLFAKANTGAEIKYKGDPKVEKKKGTGGSVRKI